jgi:hypothetical protein
MIDDQIADLEQLDTELRKACQEQTGIDPESDSSRHYEREAADRYAYRRVGAR